jgi:hypothetical protein
MRTRAMEEGYGSWCQSNVSGMRTQMDFATEGVLDRKARVG